MGAQPTSNEESSHGLNFVFNTTYSFTRDFELQGQFERREQSFAGESFGSNLYDAGLYYNRVLGGGFLGTSFPVYESTVDGSSQNQWGSGERQLWPENRHVASQWLFQLRPECAELPGRL